MHDHVAAAATSTTPILGGNPDEPRPSWAALAEFSTEQQRDDAQPVEVIHETAASLPMADAGAEPAVIDEMPEPTVEATWATVRVTRALYLLGKSVDLDTLHDEIRDSRIDGDPFVSRGVIERTLLVLLTANKVDAKDAGEAGKMRMHYALSPMALAEIDAPDVVLAQRAAVVAVLGRGLVYAPGARHAAPDLPEGGGFDLAQIGYVVMVAHEDNRDGIPGGDPVGIQIPAKFVEALGAGIDVSNDPASLETRITDHLHSLLGSGMVKSWKVNDAGDPIEDGGERAASGADGSDDSATEESEGDASGDEEQPLDSAPFVPVTVFALTLDGSLLYAEHGSLAVAAKTLPEQPEAPTAEERTTATEQAHLDYESRLVRDHTAAIAQRDTALRTAEEQRKLLDGYRAWFERNSLDDSDAIVSVKPTADRKVIAGYTIELAINTEEHFRLVAEFTAAERRLGEIIAANGEAKTAAKTAEQKAQNVADHLRALVKLPADGTKHVIAKNVYKVVEDGRIAVYSADEHDDGTVVTYEAIPRGTQTTITGSGVPVVPADPPKGKKAKASDTATDASKAHPADTAAIVKQAASKLADGMAAAGAKVTVSLDGVPTIVVRSDVPGAASNSDLPAALPALVYSTLLSLKHGATSADLAGKLHTDLSKIADALGQLGNKVCIDGSGMWVAVKAEKPVVEEPKPKADKERQTLTPAAIKTNLHDLLGMEPWSKTGMLAGDLGKHYAELVNLKAMPNVLRLVTKALEAEIEAGKIASGQGGEDRLIWRGDLPDPRIGSHAAGPAKATVDGDETDEGSDRATAAPAKRKGRGPDKKPRARKSAK